MLFMHAPSYSSVGLYPMVWARQALDPDQRDPYGIQATVRITVLMSVRASLVLLLRVTSATQRATTNCPGRNLGVPIPCPRERSLSIMATTGRGLVATLLCIGYGKTDHHTPSLSPGLKK